MRVCNIHSNVFVLGYVYADAAIDYECNEIFSYTFCMYNYDLPNVRAKIKN